MSEMPVGDGPLALGTNATVQFGLAPPYAYGFHILQGNYKLSSVMTAQVSVPCCQPPSSWTATFDYSLASRSGRVIGSGRATYVFDQWWTPYTNRYYASVIGSVLVPIPTPVSLAPGEPAYFMMTLVNGDSQHVVSFQLNDGCGFHCGGYPGLVIRIPADYYDSGIGMLAPAISQKLGTVLVVNGTLSNASNSTGISGQTVYLAVYPGKNPYSCLGTLPPTKLENATAITSPSGEYTLSWLQNSLGAYCLFVYWKGNSYFTPASSFQNSIVVGPATTSLTVHISSTVGLFSNAYRIQGTLIGLKGPISGTVIAVEYCVGTLPDKLSCSVIGSGMTDSSGTYAVTWVPTGTGNFTITAKYDGSISQEAQQATANLNIQNLYLGLNAATIAPPITAVAGIGAYVFLRRRRT
jgi:hypothetical protein